MMEPARGLLSEDSSNIKNLDINVYLTVRDAHIIDACKALECFTYFRYNHLADTIAVPINLMMPRALKERLRRHRSTLEILVLHFYSMQIHHGPGRFERDDLCFGDLRAFSKLKLLDMTQETLVGSTREQDPDSYLASPDGYTATVPVAVKDAQNLTQILPASLEHLTIRECDKRIVPLIEELLSAVADVVPRLNNLRMVVSHWAMPLGNDVITRLRELAEAAFVQLICERDDTPEASLAGSSDGSGTDRIYNS